jgi:N-acetylneuraminic acid mutarotase
MGKILIFGICLFVSGLTAHVCAQYWVQKASFGGTGRHRANGCSTSHRGYLGIGHVNGTGVNYSYKDWWEYDPSSDSWTQKADYPVANYGACCFVVNDCPVLGGGATLSTQFYKFNPQTNTWSPIADCILPNPGDVQAFAVNNKGYVYQGNQLAAYDPISNTWSMCANAPVTFGSWTASFSIQGSAYVKYGNQLYEYKPLHNQWVQRANFPGNSTGGSAGFAIQDHGYITCGYVGGLATVTHQVWSFHPESNTWKSELSFPGTSRRFPVAFAIHDCGYFGTGTNGVNMNDFWQFNPLDNTIGIEELTVSVAIAPNPSADFVTISAPYSFDNWTVQVLNLAGQVQQQKRINGNQSVLDIQDLESGNYLLLFQTEGGQQFTKHIQKL